ncbi:serine hydrolase FSH [Hypomontagnella monticulosa]|nr:serine hydrolase FSH [Hypomontagnella monticulosa]
MAAAHEAVRNRIKNEAPFDIILGFSQGAALAASLLCHEEIQIQEKGEPQSPYYDSPSHPRLCRAAIFMCSPLPFSKSLKYGTDVRRHFGITAAPLSSELQRAAPHTSTTFPGTLMPSGRYLKPDQAELVGYLDKEEGGGIGPFYQMFHSDADSLPRLSVPTVHVIGRFDQLWRNHSRELVKMCIPLDRDCAAQRWVYEFEGGHEIPKDEEEIADICDMIKELVEKIG